MLTISRASQTANQQAQKPKNTQKAIISPETAHTNQPSRIRIHKKLHLASQNALTHKNKQQEKHPITLHHYLFIYMFV